MILVSALFVFDSVFKPENLDIVTDELNVKRSNIDVPGYHGVEVYEIGLYEYGDRTGVYAGYLDKPSKGHGGTRTPDGREFSLGHKGSQFRFTKPSKFVTPFCAEALYDMIKREENGWRLLGMQVCIIETNGGNSHGDVMGQTRTITTDGTTFEALQPSEAVERIVGTALHKSIY